MKIIKLTRNQETFVDDEDFESLNQLSWAALWKNKYKGTYYAVHFDYGRIYYMGRLILDLPFDSDLQVNYIDYNTLNNQRTNIRICTSLQNQMWGKPPITNHSGYKGVSYIPEYDKWCAKIYKTEIGHFYSLKNAIEAYNEEALRMFGEFAYLNPVP
jgi:hypothetical protein